MMADLDKRIKRHLGHIRQAFRGIGTRVNSAPAVQLVQGDALANEQLQAAELMQQYGFTSNPPAGFMFIAVPVGGKTAHSVMVATEHPAYRMKALPNGEVAIYDNIGQSVHLSKSGIVITGAGLPITITDTPKVRMETPLFEVTGEIKDRCDAAGKTMSGMRTTYNGHTHNDPQGGAVAAPNQAM